MKGVEQQQRALSPKQLFERLMSGNFKQIQCEDSEQRFINERKILIQLITQYEVSIQKQVNRLKHQQQLQYHKVNLIEQLERLKKQRQIIEEQITIQLNRIKLKPQQIQHKNNNKNNLTIQLTQIRSLNAKLKFKLKDLCDYVQKLQLHNQKLQSQRNIAQINTFNRIKLNQDDYKFKLQSLKANQQTFQNQIKTKIIQKQTKQIENIRRQQQQIQFRNKQKIQQFQLNKIKNKNIHQINKYKNDYTNKYQINKYKNDFTNKYQINKYSNDYTSKYQPQKVQTKRFQHYRLI